MADVPDKQIKRLRSLITEAETSLAAAKELIVSLVGDDPVLTDKVIDKATGADIDIHSAAAGIGMHGVGGQHPGDAIGTVPSLTVPPKHRAQEEAASARGIQLQFAAIIPTIAGDATISSK